MTHNLPPDSQGKIIVLGGKQIDSLIHALYNLSPDEIKIVEEATQ